MVDYEKYNIKLPNKNYNVDVFFICNYVGTENIENNQTEH